MENSELYKTIISNQLLVTIVGTVIGGLILSIILGLWSLITKGNFIKGFVKLSKWLYKALVWLLGLLFQIVIWILKPIIRPIVLEILNEQNLNKSSKDVPSNQHHLIILESGKEDDCYYEHPMNLKDDKYEIQLSSIEGSYWRIGFKLSRNLNFTEQRHATDYPLIHLTKNIGEKLLRIDEYNQSTHSVIRGQTILENFDNDPITLIIYNDGQKNFLRIKKNGSIVYKNSFGYAEFPYSQLLAWGDGNKYKFQLSIKKVMNV